MSTVRLLGHPVAHSLSPAMHNAAFAALRLPHRYEAVDVAPERLADAVAALRADDALGANATIPHKESVARLLDELADEARAIGAVNTIVRRGSVLAGHNTDGTGFQAAAAEAGLWPTGARVLVLGAGGAARACVHTLLAGNDVLVANRSPRRAERLAREVVVNGAHARLVEWPHGGALRELRVDVVVNASPLGMAGEDPLAGADLPAVVLDIVPTLDQTPLVIRARENQNVRVMDGLAMLLHQAAGSFELWTGLPAPLEVMRAALPRPV